MTAVQYGSVPRLADHRTPFIFNEWYVAALSDEIGRTMMARTLLDRSILFFRKLDGAPVALRNRCPHRSFPLARGTLDGDIVSCGYHGIQFGPDGRCVAVPSQDSTPPMLAARSYPIVERPPLVWIWMGDPALADSAAIPDHHWLASETYASLAGYLHCRANYVRLHENVLDLTHFPYVHGDAVGGSNFIKAPATVRKQGQTVSIIRRLSGEPVNLLYGRVIGNEGHRVNRTSEAWFLTPAFHIAHAGIEDLDGGVGGRTHFHFKNIHCFTPESAHSTHYFFCNARDMRLEDEALTAATYDSVRSTFLEDDVALELVENVWIGEDSSDYTEMSVKGDQASLHMRAIIAQRAAAESKAR